MSNDMEQMVRSILQDEAEHITTGPGWTGPTARAQRWPAVAAAAVVAVLAGAVALWHTGHTGRPQSLAATGTVCQAVPSPSWKTALNGRPFSIDGKPKLVDGVLNDGTAVVQVITGRYAGRIVLIDPAGKVTPLYTLPATTGYSLQVDVSDPIIVLSLSVASNAGQVGPGSTDLVEIDARTRRITHLLSQAPVGLGGRSMGTGIASPLIGDGVVQHGTIYWTASTTIHGERQDVVVGYNTATHQFRRVGSYHGGSYVIRDARGVWWPGGNRPAEHVPASAPALGSETSLDSVQQHAVDTDGTHFAWADIPQRTVHWADSHGNVRTFEVPQMVTDGGPGFLPIVGVAGPIVVLLTTEQSATYHLLDTRTGALYDTHIDPGGDAYSVGSTLYLTRPLGAESDHRTGTVAINTAQLPHLHC